jgi:predicted transcriptional regulator
MRMSTSVRLDERTLQALDALAAQSRRPRSFLIQQAIDAYVTQQSWALAAIQRGAADVAAGRVVTIEQVWARLHERGVDTAAAMADDPDPLTLEETLAAQDEPGESIPSPAGGV